MVQVKAIKHKISVSVAYATPSKQWLFETTVPRGSVAREVIESAKFLIEIDELKGQLIDELTIGVYSQKVDLDYLLEEGDRVEIYRALTADPKEVRRQLALLGKTIGKK